MSANSGWDRWSTLWNTRTCRAHVNERIVDQHQLVEVELVGESFPFGLVQDPFVVVVSERSAELVIIHLGLALAGAPQPCHLVWVFDDELAVIPLPGDDIMVLLLPQQLQDEVPQLDLSGTRTRLRLVGPVRIARGLHVGEYSRFVSSRAN